MLIVICKETIRCKNYDIVGITGPFGIASNLVAPGCISVKSHMGTSKEDYDLYMSNLSLGHQGLLRDIGEVVAFLASESTNFITGQKIAVNEGKTFFIRKV